MSCGCPPLWLSHTLEVVAVGSPASRGGTGPIGPPGVSALSWGVFGGFRCSVGFHKWWNAEKVLSPLAVSWLLLCPLVLENWMTERYARFVSHRYVNWWETWDAIAAEITCGLHVWESPPVCYLCSSSSVYLVYENSLYSNGFSYSSYKTPITIW